MNIRTMCAGDYDAVYELWRTAPGVGLNQIDDSREGIERYLRRNPSSCFVAEHNSRIIGVILSGHDGRRGFIYHTAIADRRKGIGRALVEAALQALKKEGISKAALVAYSANDEGNAFWAACGFTVRDDLIYRNRVLS